GVRAEGDRFLETPHEVDVALGVDGGAVAYVVAGAAGAPGPAHGAAGAVLHEEDVGLVRLAREGERPEPAGALVEAGGVDVALGVDGDLVAFVEPDVAAGAGPRPVLRPGRERDDEEECREHGGGSGGDGRSHGLASRAVGEGGG